VISNVDDGLLISLAVTCDQQRSIVGSVIHIVMYGRIMVPVRSSYTTTGNTRSPVFSTTFSTLFWYSGWS